MEGELFPQDQNKIVIITTTSASSDRASKPFRITTSTFYLVQLGADATLERERLQKALFGTKTHLQTQGIHFAIHASMEDALTKRPNCKSLGAMKAVSIHGLELKPRISDVLTALVTSGLIRLNEEVYPYTILDHNAKGREMRSLVLLGKVSLGELNLGDPVFCGFFPLKGGVFYDIRAESGELKGQKELRDEHKGTVASTPPKAKASAPPTSAVTKWTASSTIPELPPTINPGAVEPYNPKGRDSAGTLVASSNVLSQHTRDISSLQAEISEIKASVKSQGEQIAKQLTYADMQKLMTEMFAMHKN